MSLIQELKAGIKSHSTEETIEIGKRLSEILAQDSILTLSGDLGAGKTTLAKGIAAGLGVKDTIKSPTYNIYSIYQGNRQLLHLDAYRLNSGHDLESLELEEFLKSPYLILIEWPEKISEWLAQEEHIALELKIDTDGNHTIGLQGELGV